MRERKIEIQRNKVSIINSSSSSSAGTTNKIKRTVHLKNQQNEFHFFSLVQLNLNLSIVLPLMLWYDMQRIQQTYNRKVERYLGKKRNYMCQWCTGLTKRIYNNIRNQNEGKKEKKNYISDNAVGVVPTKSRLIFNANIVWSEGNASW